MRTIFRNRNCTSLILNLRTCTIVIHTIFLKFSKLRSTSPSGPIRYSILSMIEAFYISWSVAQLLQIGPGPQQILTELSKLSTTALCSCVIILGSFTNQLLSSNAQPQSCVSDCRSRINAKH